jgi:GntR family transcriptional repressor for pyruvate dehydrogenase complex
MPTQSSRVHAELRDRILRGEAEPGSLLPAERALAEEMGVNRGAVREALKRLEQSGLVEITHGAGARVADWRTAGSYELLFDLATLGGSPDPGVLRAMLQMRTAHAADAARRVAANAPPDVREELAALAESIAGAGERRPRAYLEFWEAVLDTSGNVAYRLAYNTLMSRIDLFDDRAGYFAAEVGDAAAHRAIATALRDGDEEAVDRAVRALLDPAAEQ